MDTKPGPLTRRSYRLDALQLWCYRKMLKIKYVDHVMNKKVKKMLEVKQRWSEELAKRKL